MTFSSRPGTVHDPSPLHDAGAHLYPGLASVETTVRWDGNKFRDAGGRFREESRWLVRVPSGYTTFAQRTTLSLPNTTIYQATQ